ncbi:MAG: hypothetical protein WDA11_06595 [Thiohalomonadaceae bacterium]
MIKMIVRKSVFAAMALAVVMAAAPVAPDTKTEPAAWPLKCPPAC